MIKAVLLDLDNTLLHSQGAVFTAEYFRLAEDYLSSAWEQNNIANALLASFKALAGPRDMQETNLQTIGDALCRQTGLPADRIHAGLSGFYRDVYPQLRALAAPVDGAPELIRFLLESGLAVAITTNSLYPAEAIRLRLEWAGLPDDFNAYALVTHAENMHFIKAHPAFYVEAAARIGVEPDEALMVGDHLDSSILAARQVGLRAYHITGAPISHPAADAAGTLQDFFSALRSTNWLDTLTPLPPTPAMIEPEMQGNIGALFGTLADAKPHYWQQHPDAGEWSPMQIICHLLESERLVQRARLERILTETNPFLVDPPPPGPRGVVSCDDDGFEAARRFAAERLETLARLRALQPDDWQRTARHSIFGPTTLLEMAHFTAQHDRLHINQLCQTLGRCV